MIDWPAYYSDEPKQAVNDWVPYERVFRMTSLLDPDVVEHIFQAPRPVLDTASHDALVRSNGEVRLIRIHHVHHYEPIPSVDVIAENDKSVLAALEKLGVQPHETIRDDIALEWFRLMGRASVAFLKDQADIAINVDRADNG